MKQTIFSIEWAKAAGIRAIRTAAQTALGMITIGMATTEIDWMYVGSCACVAAIYSLLTSVAGLPELETTAPTSDEDIPQN